MQMTPHSTTPSQFSVYNADAESEVEENSMSIEQKAGGKAGAVRERSYNTGAFDKAIQGIMK